MSGTGNKEPINHLASAEMGAEQNYNQIDGVINNYTPSILDFLKHNEPEQPKTGGKSEKSACIEK